MTLEEMLQQTGDEPAKRHAKHHEDRLQIQCVRWFAMQYPHYAELLHHSPNGGARSKAEGAIFKQMGVRAGFPDLFLYVPSGKAEGTEVSPSVSPMGTVAGGNVYHGLAIEMKTTEKGSRQRENQKAWELRLLSAGYQYKIARTLEEFMSIVNEYIKAPQPPQGEL